MEYIQFGQLICQGAEAKIHKVKFLGDDAILKERLPKRYRHPQLDKKLTNERLLSECKLMSRARKAGVNTPYLLQIDLDRYFVIMQYVRGMKFKEWIFEQQKYNCQSNGLTQEEFDNCLRSLFEEVGKNIAMLHNDGIIHGDLTTSNIMITDQKIVYIIDFGLSYVRNNIEDFSVDLYVLEKAFLSTHPDLESEFRYILNSYEKNINLGKEILNHLDAVRQRGRKKLAFG